MNTQLLKQASLLDTDQQIELVEAIWNGIVSRGVVPGLTGAQTKELDHRLASYQSNSDQVIPWNEVKADVLARINY